MRTSLYRYLQKDGKGSWSPITSKGSYEQDVEVALESGAVKMTILSVSEIVRDEETDKKNLKYKGPLYFDIDCKEDIYQTIRSGRTLVDRLVDLGVEEADIEVYLSGSKGLHVIVGQKVFSAGRPVKRLPAIYKEIAMELFTFGMDMQVYCEGRGNAFRIPSVKRDDGFYRTRITHDELLDLTEEGYRALVSKPRNITFPAPVEKESAELVAIFQEAQKEVSRKQKEWSEAPELSDEDLQLIATDAPPCVDQLVEAKKVSGMASYNQLSMQLATYLVRVKAPADKSDHLVDLLAKNGTSSSYTSEVAKREHTQGVLQYVKSSPQVKFNCGAMKSILKTNPCSSCKLREKVGGMAQSAGSAVGVVTDPDGYFEIGKQGMRQLTNFTLKPTQIINEKAEDGSEGVMRTSVMMSVIQRGQTVCKLKMPENCWSSKSNFMRAIEGFSILVFFGSDVDLQKLKLVALEGIEDIDEMTDVYTVGVQYERLGRHDMFTYVEYKHSVNTTMITGTHQLNGRVQAFPSVMELKVPEEGEERTQEALCSWLQSNDPTIMARVVGWFSSCHIKEHIFDTHNQFPLLNTWGNAGSGKSETVKLAQHLNGVDPNARECSPVNVAGITQFAIMEYCASSTTIPRIVEEYNQSKLTASMYTYVGEVLKSAWNRETRLKGTISNKRSSGRSGATVTDYPISAPIVYVSEQQPKMPALVERTVSVKLSKNTKRGRDRHFNAAKLNRHELRRFGKAMMLSAVVNTKVKDVNELFLDAQPMVPEDLEDRPKFGLQIVFVGLKFFRSVAEKLKFNDVVDLVDELEEALYSELHDQGEQEMMNSLLQPRSEIDNMLEEVGMLVSTAELDTGALMEKGKHFTVDGDNLLLNVNLTMFAYKKYCAQVLQERPAISNPKDLLILVRDEDYFAGMGHNAGVLGGKPFIKIDLNKMASKGLDAGVFRAAK
ncbi:hypothetical protein [Endozoicomonas sp. ALC066]|uniref:hypothetical protein n=1 Tax=Endozoicomonas sp. ALC066 TaxID=3403078 RepID=UPI003BB6584C